MPKFMTYQRPTAVTKQNWNHAPDRRANLPRKAPEPQKPQAPALTLPELGQLLRRE
jgi:hypothetical protein